MKHDVAADDDEELFRVIADGMITLDKMAPRELVPPTDLKVKHKVAWLEGALLDAAVAKAIGAPYSITNTRTIYAGVLSENIGQPACQIEGNQWFSPSSNWGHGGPLIDREGLSVSRDKHGTWGADSGHPHYKFGASGPTPLIAAMRAFVALKFGEFVELP